MLEKEYTRFSARFQSKQCPYCQNTIEKLSTRSRVCPHCKEKIYAGHSLFLTDDILHYDINQNLYVLGNRNGKSPTSRTKNIT